MKTDYNLNRFNNAIVCAAFSLSSLVAMADTVLFSFNDEVVAVESGGSIYHIPPLIFRSHFGNPDYAKQIELGDGFTRFRVYSGEKYVDRSPAAVSSVRHANLLQTGSEEIVVINNGDTLYWSKRSTDRCFTEGEILWKMKHE